MGDDANEDRSGKFVFRLNDHGQGPELLRQVFFERGWLEFDEESQEEEDWNLWWRTSRFRNGDYEVLRAYQQINHYPQSTAITKKDSLARHLKRMRGVYGPSVYNFSPIAFNLPNDYTKFVAEYTKFKEKNNAKDLCWICKPADLSRGRGIFIFRDLSELQYDCNAVIQQYLTNPMLISGYKFDLRIYVMVSSFHPLNIYIYKEGLVRFSTEKFNMNNLGNMYSHLTNTSINKNSPSYTAEKERVGPGCKWTITQLRHYFRQSNVDDHMLWQKIVNIVVLTVILQANQVPKVTNCFELYGFDIIIDEQCKVWLLEVNFSPALSWDCPTDLLVKKPMIHDLLDFLNFQKEDQLRGNPCTTSNEQHLNTSQRRRRLPSIVTHSFKSMTQHQEDLAEEEEEGRGMLSDHSDVVPVIPGCGLPSVQQPVASTWKAGGGNSSCGSSASSRRSVDGAESHTQCNWRMSSTNNIQQPMKHIDSKPSQLSRLTGNSPESVREQPRSLQQIKHPSKASMQSDSGVSSYSGSSDNSDLKPPQISLEDDQTKLMRPEHLGGKMKRTRSSQNMPDDYNSGTQSSRTQMSTSYKSLVAMSGTALMNRYALTKHVPDELKRTQVSQPTSARLTSKPSLPRGTRSSNLRSSLHLEGNKKKYGQFGYTVNPLLAKSAMLKRRGTLPQMSRSSKEASNYAKPWKKGSTQMPKCVKKPSNRVLEKKVGDFYLVYPFNEATRKCSAGNQDINIVIRESQKLLKEFQATNELKAPLFDLLMLWENQRTGS